MSREAIAASYIGGGEKPKKKKKRLSKIDMHEFSNSVALALNDSLS